MTISIGDRVTHSDPYHFRGASIGLVEAVNWIGDLTIYWLSDGDKQRHPAHRSYPASDLKKVPNNQNETIKNSPRRLTLESCKNA